MLPIAALLVLSAAAFWSAPASAQAVGATLSGVVSDSSGAAIANAKISIKNVGTREVRELSSNADGIYSAPNLLPGSYEVSGEAQGFNKLVQKGITLTVGAQVALNFNLKPGQVNQVVEVEGAPPDVQTTTSAVSSTVESKTVRELPLNGRDWTTLATLEPGVASIPNQATSSFNANKGNRGFGNQLTDSGHRPNENSYRLNGISINDYTNAAPGGSTGLNLGVDAIQEFSVITTGYTAEYGRTSGAVINAITKSGTNQFHGTGFFFDRDSIFDARNYFDGPTFRRSGARSLAAPPADRLLRTARSSSDRTKASARARRPQVRFTCRTLPRAPRRLRPSNLILRCGQLHRPTRRTRAASRRTT